MSDDDWAIPDFSDETLPVLRPRRVELERLATHPIDCAGRTHVGCVRAHNEDSFLIADLGRWLEVHDSSLPLTEAQRRIRGPRGTIMMVADGMGGHGGGEIASAVAIDTIARFALYGMPWIAHPEDDEETELLEQLRDAMVRCQTRLASVAERKHLEEHKPGTTLTIAYALWPKLYVAHAGDSRLYLYRDGELTQLTRDHTIGQALRDSGAIGEGPSRFDHVLLNVVGGTEQSVSADALSLELRAGDRVVLCSDGLYSHVSRDAMRQALVASATSAEVCDVLVQAAINDGAKDNVTVVIAST